MSNALEITRDIIVAAFGSTSSFYPNKDSGDDVAEFIQVIYDKVKELEDAELKSNEPNF